MNNIPGMVAKLQIISVEYSEMVQRAETYFERLFQNQDWVWLGALIEPYSYSEVMNAQPDEPEKWIGEFYAMVPRPEEE